MLGSESAAVMETDSLDQSRTVVVSGVPDLLPADRIVDKLTIHFQTRRRSDGGDVEVVKYPTNMEGVAFVTFDRAEGNNRLKLTTGYKLITLWGVELVL